MHNRFSTLVSTGLLALGMSSGVAMAQQTSPTPNPPRSTTTPATNYSDAQLNTFINASQKVAMISQEYTAKVQTAKDDAAKQQVIKEADDKMVKAVQREGMTVDQFNGLNRAAQEDPALLQRIQKMANK